MMKLLCPNCGALMTLESSLHPAACGHCKRPLDFDGRMFDLRHDTSLDTLLNIDTYDSEHGVSGYAASLQLWKYYESMIVELGGNVEGNALEIASGSGHLTLGLATDSRFEHLVISDISPRFMQRLLAKLNDGSLLVHNVIPMLFDANALPFPASQFNLVIGNSVLHHFANFEATLSAAYTVLKPGGIAIFGEPVMDTFVFAPLAAKLVLDIDERAGWQCFNEREQMILRAITKLADYNLRNLQSDRQGLADTEDKFIFPVSYMRDLSEKIGFRKFNCLSPPIEDFGSVVKGILERILIQEEIDPSRLSPFNFVFDALQSTYGKTMKEDLKAAFSFFAFIK